VYIFWIIHIRNLSDCEYNLELYRITMDKSPIMNIGKSLLSEGIINEIITLLKNRGIIKVGIQKNALEMATKEQIMAKVIQITECYLLDVRGNNFVISRKPLKGFKVPLSCKRITDLSKTEDLSDLDSNEAEDQEDDEVDDDLNDEDIDDEGQNSKDEVITDELEEDEIDEGEQDADDEDSDEDEEVTVKPIFKKKKSTKKSSKGKISEKKPFVKKASKKKNSAKKPFINKASKKRKSTKKSR
jgi:RNA-binding protein YhbY